MAAVSFSNETVADLVESALSEVGVTDKEEILPLYDGCVRGKISEDTLSYGLCARIGL